MLETLDYTIHIGSTPTFLQARTGLCPIVPLAEGPFRGFKIGPWPDTQRIANKQLFNSGFVKLVKRKMVFFQTFK